MLINNLDYFFKVLFVLCEILESTKSIVLLNKSALSWFILADSRVVRTSIEIQCAFSNVKPYIYPRNFAYT